MKVAILGVGEVGSTLAQDLLRENVEVAGWDPKPRNLPAGLRFAESNSDAVKGADLILSTNLAAVSIDVALEVLPSLRAGQVYADLNTASPMTKQEIDLLFQASLAQFTDVAVMAPIAPKRLQTALIASGEGAKSFADYLSRFGTPITVLDEPAGHAATLKLVRSIFYKGLAAVVMETLETAEKLDLTDYAREQMMTILSDESMIDRFVSGSYVHASRRIHEMDAVVELLEDIGVQAYSSSAARQRLQDIVEKKDAQ